jgi:KaiC/GvpD/RAD55 family RecA-like ATPase
MQPDSESSPLPYANIARPVLGVIYESLEIIYQGRFERLPEDDITKRLISCATTLKQTKSFKAQRNTHITDGIRRRDPDWETQHLDYEIPRISRLCLEACDRVHRRHEWHDGGSGIFVPSPLAILVDALTLPVRSESSAYGFALARAMLFNHFKLHPPGAVLPEGWSELAISEVQEAFESFRIYAKHRDNIHYPSKQPARAFLAHFVALSGIFVLRFGTVGRETQNVSEAQSHCLEFFRNKQFSSPHTITDVRYEFRLAPGLEDLPETNELLNSLLGVPMPLPGASTVFFGGLQRSHHNSAVVSVSGPAGTGKTSFALAMAASLAPFGTKCLYCSFEEDPATLERRAIGLVPPYFRRTSMPNAQVTEWLVTINLEPSKVTGGVKGFTSNYLPLLQESLKSTAPSKDKAAQNQSLPAIAPLILVIDSLTTIFGNHGEVGQLEDFCEFVRQLRELNCIVLLLSAEEIPHTSRLEYLVDTVISLSHRNTEEAEKKPFRIFQLVKTRLQMSRPGSHLLHVSGGLKICPQLPSQLDSHTIHKPSQPERSLIINTLSVDAGDGFQTGQLMFPTTGPVERLTHLFPKSRILIHGIGSSGKAALALKILVADSVNAKSGEQVHLHTNKQPRVLVVSFLYGAGYYHTVFEGLPQIVSEQQFRRKPEIVVLPFAAGFIRAEDFVEKVLAEMDRGHYEGWSYTGVLLDGLHNTFLQFPALQKNPMLWPTLYNLLSRYELTTVTTFTTFARTHSAVPGHPQADEELLLEGQLPFLHTLAQGTDFFLELERPDPQDGRRFHLVVKSALNQRIPSQALVWNADMYTFERFETVSPRQTLAQPAPVMPTTKNPYWYQS